MSFLTGVRESIGSSLGNLIASPKKQGTPAALSDPPMGSPDLSQHGTKRKADVYDPPEDDEVVLGRNGSAKKTPSNKQRWAAPNSAINSAGRIKRRSRASAVQEETVDERVDAPLLLERAIQQDAPRLQSDLEIGNSVHVAAPVADMGDGLLDPPVTNETVSTPNKNDATRSSPSKETMSSKRSARKATKEADTVEAAAPEPEDEVDTQPKEEEADEEVEEEQEVEVEAPEDGEVAEVKALLKHKLLEDKSVDILVHWVDESASQATWEPESEIQNGASELLFKYWKEQGGRTKKLFGNGKETEEFHIFQIVGHQKLPKGGFKMEVQWVGYPATKGETSLEPETKLKQIARELLDEYWETVGGRSSHLNKRGRAKKARKN